MNIKDTNVGYSGWGAILFNGISLNPVGYDINSDDLYPIKSSSIQRQPSITQEEDIHGASDDMKSSKNFYIDGVSIFQGELSLNIYRNTLLWDNLWQWILGITSSGVNILKPTGIIISTDGVYANCFEHCFVTRFTLKGDSGESGGPLSLDLSIVAMNENEVRTDYINVSGERSFEGYVQNYDMSVTSIYSQKYSFVPWFQTLIHYKFGETQLYANDAEVVSFNITSDLPWKPIYLLQNSKTPQRFKRGIMSVSGGITLVDVVNGIPQPSEEQRHGIFMVGVKGVGTLKSEYCVINKFSKPTVSKNTIVSRTIDWVSVPEQTTSVGTTPPLCYTIW